MKENRLLLTYYPESSRVIKRIEEISILVIPHVIVNSHTSSTSRPYLLIYQNTSFLAKVFMQYT